jgi:hypothetical protein
MVAVAAVISSGFLQYKNVSTQTKLKYQEIETKPKQEGYSSFMKSLNQIFLSSITDDDDGMINHINDLETAYFSLEPFLGGNERRSVWETLKSYEQHCFKMNAGSKALRQKENKVYGDSPNSLQGGKPRSVTHALAQTDDVNEARRRIEELRHLLYSALFTLT